VRAVPDRNELSDRGIPQICGVLKATGGAGTPTLLRDDVSKKEPEEHGDHRASRDYR
jgi:hypothetical protein